jgi:hypothetical protein
MELALCDQRIYGVDRLSSIKQEGVHIRQSINLMQEDEFNCNGEYSDTKPKEC